MSKASRRGPLRSILDTAAKVKPKLPRIIGIASVGGVLSYFIWLHYTPTTIRLDIQATDMSFDVNPQRVAGIFEGIDTPELYLSHFKKIDLGQGQFGPPSSLRTSSNAAIEAESAEETTATVEPAALSRIVARDNRPVRVLISWQETEPEVIRLALDSIESIRLSPPIKAIAVNCTSCRAEERTADSMSLIFAPARGAQEASVLPGNGSLRLGIKITESTGFRIDDVAVAEHLGLYRSGETRPTSSIIDGTVYFTDVGIEQKIGAQLVELQGLSDFRISDVHLKRDENGQVMGFHATIAGGVRNVEVDGKDVSPSVIARGIGTERRLTMLSLIFTAIGAIVTAIVGWEAISDKLNWFKEKSK